MEFRNVDYGTGFETLSAGVSETTPQSGLRSENVRLRNEGFIEIFKMLGGGGIANPGEGRRATGMPSSSKKHGAVRVPDSIEEAVQDVRTKPRHPAE